MTMQLFAAGAVAAAALLGAGAAAAQSQDVRGEWLTPGGSARVRIAPCPGQVDRLCGEIVALKSPNDARGQPKRDRANANPALRSRPIVGMPFITGFKAAGPGRWTGGRIYNPEDGKTYNSKLTLKPNGTLKVDGCVLVVCQGQTWTRAS